LTSYRGDVEDADGDGDLDLVLHFEIVRTGIDHGDTSACLTGQTHDGIVVADCDAIIVRQDEPSCHVAPTDLLTASEGVGRPTASIVTSVRHQPRRVRSLINSDLHHVASRFHGVEHGAWSGQAELAAWRNAGRADL
jgi:hypothetical protein